MTSNVSRGEIGVLPPVAGAASWTDVDCRPPSARAIAICCASCVRLFRSAAIWSASRAAALDVLTLCLATSLRMRLLSVSDCACRAPTCSLAPATYCALMAPTE